MYRRAVARPQIAPERQNGVPGYTCAAFRGIWSMAVNKIWIEIEYQTENQTTIGTKGNRLTDSGIVYKLGLIGSRPVGPGAIIAP